MAPGARMTRNIVKRSSFFDLKKEIKLWIRLTTGTNFNAGHLSKIYLCFILRYVRAYVDIYTGTVYVNSNMP